MDITLATFDHAPETALRGVRFNNTWVPSETYADSRRGTLTGQYPQRQATTRISEVFAGVGYEVREDTQPAGEDVFRLLEQPSLEELDQVERHCRLLPAGRKCPHVGAMAGRGGKRGE